MKKKIEDLILATVILLFICFIVFLIYAACIVDKKNIEAKQNLCVQQYGEKAYHKAINYGRGASTVDYCVVDNGELKILKSN